MAATNWHYFTPFDPDPEAALQRLRRDVFAAGRYTSPAISPANYLRKRYQDAGLGAAADEAVERLNDMQRAFESGADEDLKHLPRAQRAAIRRARELMALTGVPPRRAGRTQPPRTIEELLEISAESGTHSILDITQTSRRRRQGTASLLSDREVRKIFGTTEPTHDQIEGSLLDVWEKLSPWQAVYVVVYCDGQPSEYAFIGCSGD
jgi:hypothetical protein